MEETTVRQIREVSGPATELGSGRALVVPNCYMPAGAMRSDGAVDVWEGMDDVCGTPCTRNENRSCSVVVLSCVGDWPDVSDVVLHLDVGMDALAWMHWHGYKVAQDLLVEDPGRAWAGVIVLWLVFPMVLVAVAVWARRNDRRQHWELEGEIIRMYQDGALVAEVPVASVERLGWRKQNLFLWTREKAGRRFRLRGVGWESYQALLVALGLRKYRVSWVGRWLGSAVRR